MKKIVSVLLSLLLVVATLSVFASADAVNSGTIGKSVTWTFDAASGRLTISGSGEMPQSAQGGFGGVRPWEQFANNITEVVVTEGVTVLAHNCFTDLKALKTAKLADSLTNLGYATFSGCVALEQVNLPANLKELSYTFSGCENLKQPMIIPESCTVLNGPFEGCGVNTIVLPKAMKNVPDYVLMRASGITTIFVSDGIETIGNYAFQETGIKNLVLPQTVKSIGNTFCKGCQSLTYVSLSDAITEIPMLAFGTCQALTTIHLPSALKTISDYAFNWCSALETVTIPATVSEINEGAFLGCTALKDVWFTGTQAQWNAIKIGADNDCLLNANIHFNAPADKNSLVFGDFNSDGAVRVDDARMVLRSAIGLEKIPASRVLIACDVDNDGKVTVSDARLTLRIAINLPAFTA